MLRNLVKPLGLLTSASGSKPLAKTVGGNLSTAVEKAMQKTYENLFKQIYRNRAELRTSQNIEQQGPAADKNAPSFRMR